MKIRIRISLDVPMDNSWKMSPMVEIEEEVPADKEYKEFYMELYQKANFMFWKTLLSQYQIRESVIQKGPEEAAQGELGQSLGQVPIR